MQPRQRTDAHLLPEAQRLGRAHVARWFEHPAAWIDEIRKRQGTYNWIRHWMISCEGTAIGFCQYDPYEKSGEIWHGTVETAGT